MRESLLKYRLALAVLATAAILVPLGWMWWSSLVPGTYSTMAMGVLDAGGGPATGHQGHGSGGQANAVSVTALTGPRTGSPDVDVTLTARKERFTPKGGRSVDGYTLNHTSPGPEIRARAGDLVQVTLVNDSVPEGVTLHWHGVALPNAEDGVAGVTQDAVGPGGRHVYRFVADRAGTYWYHSHQVSHRQVRGGLFGALIVEEAAPGGSSSTKAPHDVVAQVHTYQGLRTVGGQVGESRVDVAPGTQVRVRVINTDEGPLRTWVAGAPYRITAVDARVWNAPTPVTDRAVLLTAGGRVDVEFTMPADGSAVRIGAGGGRTSMVLGAPSAKAPSAEVPGERVDLLSYGTRTRVGFDAEQPDRSFDYRVGRRPGFVDGRPGMWWSINGKLFPDVPMFLVSEGDVVRMRVANSSGEVHPMHLHGHHVLVLSRDGVPATGAQWWTDSLNVEDGEEYEIAFVADNPGVWADHCHNLPHAAEGLLAHLAYSGVTSPFRVGGPAENAAE